MIEKMYETTNGEDDTQLNDVIIDGLCVKKMKQNMLSSGRWNDTSLNRVLSTACSAVSQFPDNESTRKILCLGKVQSGKTAFFIVTMALAMDNGYNLIYVIGGTKNNLLNQNKGRVRREFSNNDDVFITSINNAKVDDIRQKLSSGIKVVVMVLKGKSENSDRNLQRMEDMTEALSDVPSVVIDDEGDQVSPGKEKNVKKMPVIHHAIVNSVGNLKKGVYLSVTATPQANLLVSTINGISPDRCVLVEPGEGYTGANVFHDSLDNSLVEGISDSSEFEESIPESFIRALYFFLVGCAIQRISGIDDKYSMLIHPSASTRIQHDIKTKVDNLLNGSIRRGVQSPNSMGYEEILEEIKRTLKEFEPRFDVLPSAEQVIDIIKNNLVRTNIFEVNTPADFDEDQEQFSTYKIYVGGNMLERGITLDNLSVTYIYRVAKKDNAVDTMFQRARWFGYKKDYLYVCKVYMPVDMKEMFVDMTNHENFLWYTMKNYLKKSADIKKMPRLFQLSDKGSLILTRKSITKTVKVGGINPGYAYDKSIWYKLEEDIKKNNDLWQSFFDNHKSEKVRFGNFNHLVIRKYKITSLYKEVLCNLSYPLVSHKVNDYYFTSLLTTVNEGLLPDEITIVKMRDGVNEFRSMTTDKRAIKELPQSYDVKTGYPGDKVIYEDELNLQVHYVYTDREFPEHIIPMLAINNPCDTIRINYMTGDNEYETE